ncbi:hypothetical protein ABK040_016849 [Willaertia magna]
MTLPTTVDLSSVVANDTSTMVETSLTQQQQQLVITDDAKQSRKKEFPEELHLEILDYFINPKDGFNYLLCFVNNFHLINDFFNYHTLFKIVYSYQKFNKWYDYYGKAIFEINKNQNIKNNSGLGELIPFQWHKLENNNNNGIDKNENYRKIKLLQNATTKIVNDLTYIKSQLDYIININVDDYFEKKLKYKEWKYFLNKIAKKHSPNLANTLYQTIFKKVKILKAKIKRIDFHYQYKAIIKINNFILIHNAYDDEGCNPNWSLHFCDSLSDNDNDNDEQQDSNNNKYRNKYAMMDMDEGDLICEMSESNLSIYKEQVLEVREYLSLEENKVLLLFDDKLLVKCLIHSLPWQWRCNAVFYNNISFI